MQPLKQLQGRYDGIASLETLEGLARLHPFVLVSDTRGRVQWMSDALSRVCGDSTEHLGRPVEQAFAPFAAATKRRRFVEQIEEIRTDLGQHRNVDGRRIEVRSRDGKPEFVEVSAFHTLSQSGHDVIVTTLRSPSADETDIAAHPLHLALLEASPDALLAVDDAGYILYANPMLGRLFGLDAAQLPGRPVSSFLPHSAAFVEGISRLRDEASESDLEVWIERSDGSRVCAALSASALPTPDRPASAPPTSGTPSIVVTLRDVTARVAERARLEAQNADLDSYVHSVAHDLRSPLVSLLGFGHLLRADYAAQLDETAGHYIDRIEQASRRMESLIDDLLELSRIGSAGEHRALVDPHSILLQLQSELKLRLDDADVQLLIPETPPLVLCDPTRLYQLFSNLVGNALQHMGPCADRRIQILISEHPAEHILSVIDYGQGIAKADQQSIFDVFRTLARGGSPTGSTGVGLAIVKKIAQTQGGSVYVESDLGHGARFDVHLPRHSFRN